MIIGRKRYIKTRQVSDELLKNILDDQLKMIDEDRFEFNDPLLKDYKGLVRLNIMYGESTYTQDNKIDIFTDTREKLAKLFEDIKNAKESIIMVYFIIKPDEVGKSLVSALAKKAAEGVDIKFMYDEVGSIFTPIHFFHELVKAGGKVQRFLPSKFGINFNINYRNHRKIVVIDDKIGYIGSANIGREYIGLHKRIKPWRDTHLRITGSSVQILKMRFYLDWVFASSAKNDREIDESLHRYFKGEFYKSSDYFSYENNKGIGVQIVSSGPDMKISQVEDAMLRMITNAKKTIYIQTPYFIPDESMLKALRLASLSGVGIHIMLPKVPDKSYVLHASYSYVRDLLEMGIKVYLYKGFLHSKTITVDSNVCSIGTTNLDIRSFILHFEINAFIFNSTFSKKHEEIFFEDMKNSELLENDWYKKRGLWAKFNDSFFRLFSPLM